MRSDVRDDAGSAVVEFALLLPVLFVVGLALVQIAVLARDQLILAEAARAGARTAAVDVSEVAVRDAALRSAVGLEGARLSVEIERAGTRGDPVTVRVSYPAPTAAVLSGWLLPPTVLLSDSATMRQEFG